MRVEKKIEKKIEEKIISSVKNSQGIFFYHAHFGKERALSYKFLEAQIPALKAAGVKDICLELTPQELDLLNKITRTRAVQEFKSGDKFDFVKKMRGENFMIHAVDTHDYDGSGPPGSKSRTLLRHSHIEKMVGNLLASGKKIALLLGPMHIQLSEKLGVPGIVLAAGNAPDVASVEEYLDLYLSSYKIQTKFKQLLAHHELDTDLKSTALNLYKIPKAPSTFNRYRFYTTTSILAGAAIAGIFIYEMIQPKNPEPNFK